MSTPALTPQQLADTEQRALHEGYFFRLANEFDVFWNVATDGLPRTTISSRAQIDATTKNELWAKVLTHILDMIQANHGVRAEAGDLAKGEQAAAVEAQALGIKNP